MRKPIAARAATASLGLLTSALAPAPALAQEAQDAGGGLPTDWSVSANVAFTTDYRWRGVSFSDGDFAVQGGFDLAHEGGFYAGVWASSIETYGGILDTQVIETLDENGAAVSLPVATFLSGGETELDVYAGFSGGTDVFAYDLGVLWYFYPGSFVDTDYGEVYGSLSTKTGAATLTGGVGYIWDQDNTFGGDNAYVFAALSTPLGGTGAAFDAHLGYTEGAFALANDQLDWSLGVSYELAGLTLSAAYVATDADTDVEIAPGVFNADVTEDLEDALEDVYGDTAIFTVSKTF